jgi:MYXO-CTERM domain-containing protein
MTHRTPISVASISLLGSSLGLLLCLSVGGPAAAAPPASGGAGPEQEACAGRASGDACTLPNNQLGTCAPATCNRLDYSGGSPPKAIEEPCIVCKSAGAQPHDGPPMLGGDGGASPGEGEGDGEPSSSGSVAETKEPPESSSRCRLDPSAPNPAGLALLAGLLLFARRRRGV